MVDQDLVCLLALWDEIAQSFKEKQMGRPDTNETLSRPITQWICVRAVLETKYQRRQYGAP